MINAESLVYLSIRLKNRGRGLPQLVKNINRVFFECDVSFDISLGNNLKLPHQGLGVVIGPKVVIGNNVTIYQNVTLGAKVNGQEYTAPVIGENVIIGANAVVLSDVPNDCLAVGVPAINKRMEKE